MTTEKEVSAFIERAGRRFGQTPRPTRSGEHRAAFIAILPFVEGMRAHGYSMKATWASLREEQKLSMSYQTFRRHCRGAGMVQSVQRATPAVPPRPQPPEPAAPAPAPPGTVGVAQPTERRFRHERVPRKKDIYG